MYNVGEMVFYGGHGVCEIEEITTMTVANEEKRYYRLKSHVQPTLSLFHPVVTDKPKISKVLTKVQAEEIMTIFEEKPSDWIERSIDRAKMHKKVLEKKDHKEVARMLNVILRKQHEFQQEGKKLYAQDLEIIRSVLAILSDEIALSLQMDKQDVLDRIEALTQEV